MTYKKTATRALEDRRDIERFSRKFNVYVSESRQYRRREVSPQFIDFNTHQYNYTLDTHDVPYVELHMPAESLDHIIQLDEHSSYDRHQINHAMDVLRQHRADESVRNSNQAVQKAWRNYITLLEIARN